MTPTNGPTGSPPPEPIGAVAARYAARALAVLPLFTIDGGACSCGNPACPSPGKHPIGTLVPHGVADAQADERAAVEWWASYHDANIGIATGDVSGVVVLDVDLPGFATLNNLEGRHGALPVTWRAETGSGGEHVWFRMPAADVRNSAGAVGPGIDVRGNGGYVVAPPSRHVSGAVYRWLPEAHPRRVGLADVPDWLLRRMAPGAKTGASPLPRILAEGMRNTWLASAAGTMRRRGFSPPAIAAALAIENRLRCRPPLDDREVARIAGSIARYEPAEGLPRGA